MKLVLTEGGRVDFSVPPWMSDERADEFIRFLEDLVGEGVESVEVDEPQTTYEVGERNPKAWEVEEYARLLEPLSNEQLALALDRSPMSIQMKRGEFCPAFAAWLHEEGKRYSGGTDLIERFFEDTGGNE